MPGVDAEITSRQRSRAGSHSRGSISETHAAAETHTKSAHAELAPLYGLYAVCAESHARDRQLAWHAEQAGKHVSRAASLRCNSSDTTDGAVVHSRASCFARASRTGRKVWPVRLGLKHLDCVSALGSLHRGCRECGTCVRALSHSP
jgi:hypothetical protein